MASRASSSRSTFCASRRNAPSPTGVGACRNMPGFRWCATMPEHLRAHVVAVDRVDVQPIEHGRRRRDARLLVIERSDAAVDERRRRRLAEVVADGAEHHGELLARDRDRRCASRASSITSSVCTQTSPSGCHSGSCGQPTSAFSSGNSRSMTPSSSASAKPIDGRAASSSSFSISPQIRSAGRSSSGDARGRARAVAGVERELEARGELDRAQHAQAVVAERRADRRRAARGASRSPRPSTRIEVLVGQRIPGDRVDREVAAPRRLLDRQRRGRPSTSNARWPRPTLRLAARQRHVDVRRPCRP